MIPLIVNAIASGIGSSIVTLLGFITSRTTSLIKGKIDPRKSSLASFTKATRVEPIALIDSSIAHQPWMGDIILATSSIFTGYYLQAVALTSTAINGVSVLKVLDPLNPDRDTVGNAIKGWGEIKSDSIVSTLSHESYTLALPRPGKPIAVPVSLKEPGKSPSLENDNNTSLNVSDSRPFQRLTDESRLSVGRVFNVKISQGENTFEVPVMVRIISTIVQQDVLTHILGNNKRKNSFSERIHMWRAGQLQFIRDIIMMQDLIDEHKKLLNKDSSGVYSEIMRRRRNNSVNEILTGNVSIGAASNIVVISKRTAQAVEKMGNGRIADYAFRQAIFTDSYMLLMVVVDEEMERVSIYHRDNKIPTQMSLKELKNSNKGSGPDVMEILKAYQLGGAVRP